MVSLFDDSLLIDQRPVMGKGPDVPAKKKKGLKSRALFHKIVLLIRILAYEPLNPTQNVIYLH